MNKQVEFRFYQELNDFLTEDKKFTKFYVDIKGRPSVKDTIEAIGIPHTEVDLILVNDQSVTFDYQLQGAERVAVYPVFELLDITPINNLRAKPLREPKFILDVHLGKLAKYMRLLGLDVLYENDYSDPQIMDISLLQHRTIITRDLGILKHRKVTHGYWCRSTKPCEQIQEVVEYFDLTSQIATFTRCLRCNDKLRSVEKKEYCHLIPPKAYEFHNEFYHCQSCHKLYWPGTHYENMQKIIQYIS